MRGKNSPRRRSQAQYRGLKTVRLASAGAALWRYVSGNFSLTWARQHFDVDRVCDTLIS